MKKRVMKMMLSIRDKAIHMAKDNSGQGAIETACTILIAVVLAALLLGGLYALIDDTVLPSLTQKIQEMFNYTH